MGSRQSRRATRDVQYPRVDNPLYTPELNPREAERIAMESSLAEAPLPPGWDQAVCSKTGATYFIDHLTRSTTFTDPRLPDRRGRGKRGKAPHYENTFYARCQHLRARLRQLQNDTEPLTISIKRESLFQDSFDLVGALDSATLTGRLSIKFEGEKGLDYGGMSREWFLELSREILCPKRGLFVQRGKHYVINPASTELKNWHSLFSFVGTVLGMAVYHGKLFHSYFIGAFYKILCDTPIELVDMKDYDESIYKSLKYILDTTGCTEDLDLDFTLNEAYVSPTETPGGPATGTRTVELRPDGVTIAVTEENKADYVRLCVEHYLAGTTPQMNALKDAFYQFCPKDILAEIFTWHELPELIGGLQIIDIEDMRTFCEYRGYNHNTPVVQWFWEIVANLHQEDLRLFLKFVTGTDKVPVGGFEFLYGSNGPQKLTLNRAGKRSGLPAAHSCFNRLDLPEYSDKTQLRDALLYAIRESKTFDIE